MCPRVSHREIKTFISRTVSGEGADALIIVTEWKEFRSPDFEDIRHRLREPVLFDGRNLYDPAMVRSAGLEYHGVGRVAGL